ncbi:MAG: DedA family protein [Oculatellaceae cyanobacterium bins.114]|nr:DedA family protein [Oculatellaceae cyanobacterium bins.114]
MSLELISLETLQELAHHYGYGAVFVGILLENAGVPIPGETITLVGGFLAGSDELNYWFVLGSATAGAVIGDNIGYWVGFYGGWSLLSRVGQLFKIREEKLIEVREQFSQNAAKAVFLGRFVALLRIFAGPLAGIAKMPYPKFFLWNLAGAAIWASAMVSLSYFVGQIVPLEVLIQGVAQFGVVTLLIIATAIAIPLWLERRGKGIEAIVIDPIKPQEQE